MWLTEEARRAEKATPAWEAKLALLPVWPDGWLCQPQGPGLSALGLCHTGLPAPFATHILPVIKGTSLSGEVPSALATWRDRTWALVSTARDQSRPQFSSACLVLQWAPAKPRRVLKPHKLPLIWNVLCSQEMPGPAGHPPGSTGVSAGLPGWPCTFHTIPGVGRGLRTPIAL